MHSHTPDRQFQLLWSLMSVLIQCISGCRDHVCVLKGSSGVGGGGTHEVCRCNGGRRCTLNISTYFWFPATVLCADPFLLYSDVTVVSCKKLPGHGEQLCLLLSVCWLMQRLLYISGLQVKLQLAASQRGDKPWGECVFVRVWTNPSLWL